MAIVINTPALEFLRDRAEHIHAELRLPFAVELRLTRDGSHINSDNPTIVHLNLNDAALSRDNMVTVLAHEMRHQYQLANRHLGFEDTIFGLCISWHGELWPDNRGMAHDLLPWEVDAIRFEIEYLSQYPLTHAELRRKVA